MKPVPVHNQTPFQMETAKHSAKGLYLVSCLIIKTPSRVFVTIRLSRSEQSLHRVGLFYTENSRYAH